VRRVTPVGITTIAGVLPSGSARDNIPAVTAPLFDPWGVAADSAGSIYISDVIDQRIKKVSPAGTINTFAGDGVYGNSTGEIGGPRGLAFDRAGNLYVTSGSGQSVRRVTPAGDVTTVAGSGTGMGGSIGDGGLARDALLLNPFGLGADAAGNLFVADSSNQKIRRVDTSGKITTFAGTGEAGYGGDDGPAAAAKLLNPRQMAADNAGNLYVADVGNSRIRKITPAGAISTFAGNGVSGGAGDGGPATAAQLTLSGGGVAVDVAGNVYIDTTAKIRRVDASTGVIGTIAGTGTQGFSGDGGPATSAALDTPTHLAIDSSGAIYFTDRNNTRVRKLTPAPITLAGVVHAATLQSGPVAPGEIVVINGAAIGPAQTASTQVTAAGVLGKALGGFQVLFDATPAALISAQANQITAIVPYAVAGQSSTQLKVVVSGASTNAVSIPVAGVSPGIFTQDASGTGAGTIFNADSSANSPSNAAAAGSVVTVLVTGEGQTKPPGVDGLVAPDTPPSPAAEVTARIGGIDAQVINAGGVPGLAAGFFQVAVQIPDGVATGDAIPVVLTVGGVDSQPGITLSIQ
jgi:uncharacterized protein (TIGR03437 family)